VDGLVRLLTEGVINDVYGRAYSDVRSLHYPCQPAALEDLTVIEFFDQYEVVRRDVQNNSDLLEFRNTQYFTHPCSRLTHMISYPFGGNTGRGLLGRPNGCIPTRQCLAILALCVPHRCAKDLMEDAS